MTAPRPERRVFAIMNSDSDSDPEREMQHTGQAPSRRPPADEPERVGEGELGSDAPYGVDTVLDDEDDLNREATENPRAGRPEKR